MEKLAFLRGAGSTKAHYFSAVLQTNRVISATVENFGDFVDSIRAEIISRLSRK